MEAFQRPQEWDVVAEKYERAFVKVSRKFAAHALRLASVQAGMRLLDVAAAGLKGVTVNEMDGQALTFPDDTFDAAFSIFGLMFFPDRAKGMREMHRVLRPEGRVGIVVWNRPDRVGNLRLLGHAIQQAAPEVLMPTDSR